MSRLSGETIGELGIITPHQPAFVAFGLSGGDDIAGYNITLRDRVTVYPVLSRIAVSVESFDVPNNVAGEVLNKSTLARLGLDAAAGTDIEPGWRGEGLTIELRYHPRPRYWRGLVVRDEWLGDVIRVLPFFAGIVLPAGMPIAKIKFDFTDRPTRGYAGKYQYAKNTPQDPIFQGML